MKNKETLKQIYHLQYDSFAFKSGLINWYNSLLDKTPDELDENDVLLTASLVGAPNAPAQFMTPKDIAKTVEILQKNCDFNIGGIITNEQGGEATVNGWY